MSNEWQIFLSKNMLRVELVCLVRSPSLSSVNQSTSDSLSLNIKLLLFFSDGFFVHQKKIRISVAIEKKKSHCMQHFSKYLILCSMEERRFGTTWKWVNEGIIFIFVFRRALKDWESSSPLDKLFRCFLEPFLPTLHSLTIVLSLSLSTSNAPVHPKLFMKCL